MSLKTTLKEGLDRAGRAAKTVVDEGRVRLEAMRARQLADRSAQALGYAVYRARQSGGDLDAETYARLADTLRARDNEARTLETQIETLAASRASGSPAPEGTTTSG